MSGILLATHGGESAEGAARVATLLSRRPGVALRAVAVLEPLNVIGDGFGATYVPTAREIDATRNALLGAVADQLGRCGVQDGNTEFRVGVVASEIATAARAFGADLIVVGLGPHHIIDRALGGETALHLAQEAATPVLAVPADATSIPYRAVVAVDFSPTSILAACTVAHWLTRGDTLHLVHVVAPKKQAAGGRSATADVDESALARLGEVAASLQGAPPACIETVQLHGDPARTILDYARQVDADVIALGSHGYGLWKRLMLGSVASKVIRLSPRAVLVAPVACLATAAAVGAQAAHSQTGAASVP